MAREVVLRCVLALALLASCATVSAGGQLLATGGLTQLEGSAGGGLVPWAALAGYGTAAETGATAFISHVNVSDYQLNAAGAAVTVRNRLELSAARQVLTQSRGAGPLGDSLAQDVFGAKLRLAGDLVYTGVPQISAGIQYKRNHGDALGDALGAQRLADWDAYLAVSRLFLGAAFGRNVLLNATVRGTRANELGLLGFGGPGSDSHTPRFEGSAALFLDRRTAIGYEYRAKPDNLGLGESDWHDLFIAYFPSKSLGLAAALTDLGRIGGVPGQQGLYLSAQGSF